MERSCMEMDTEDWELLPIPNHSPNTLKETDSAFVDNHYFTLPSQPSSRNRELVEGAKGDGSSPLQVEFKDVGVAIVTDRHHASKNSKDGILNAAEPPSFGSGSEGMDEEEEQAEEKPCREGLGLKAWSWKLAGGVAAICVLAALGGRQQPKHEPRFQIYADDDEKKIMQVMQQATRLNRTLTAVRGAPMATTRADISFRRYYDGL